MIQIDMSAAKRESFGKGAMRRLRGTGNTPAILYGNDKEVMPLQLETNSFLKNLFQINRKNAVVNLSINGGETRHVIVKEIQTDPVDDSLVHADFHEIDLQKTCDFTVAIEFSGKAKGEDVGGEVTVHNAKIMLTGTPLEIPDVITVDVSGLDVGDVVLLKDVAIPENVKMASSDSRVCVEVISANAAAAAAAAAENRADAADAADAAAALESEAVSADDTTENSDEAESSDS